MLEFRVSRLSAVHFSVAACLLTPLACLPAFEGDYSST